MRESGPPFAVRVDHSPSRVVHHAEALAWLAENPLPATAAIVTSLPDISESRGMDQQTWRAWFVATAERRPDAKLTALFEALPDQEFTITLQEFSTEADSATQTYKATFTMPRPVGVNIFPGMTCTAIHYAPVSGEEDGSQFTIPAAAVIDEGGKQHVWVIDSSDITSSRPIQVGDLVGEDIRVVDGLHLGEINGW